VTLYRWMRDPDGYAMRRAETAALREYFRLRDAGATTEAAATGATAKLKETAERLGLVVKDVSISSTSTD
jgi:hypothetical protein